MYRPTKLKLYLEKLREHGQDPRSLLAEIGIDYTRIDRLEPIDEHVSAQILDMLGRKAPPDFGIRCGLATSSRHCGVAGYAAANAPTVHESFRTWIEYFRSSGYFLRPTLIVGDDVWEYRLSPLYALTPAALRFATESALFSIIPDIYELTGRTIETVALGFPYGRHHVGDLYDNRTPGRLMFDQAAAIFVGRRSDLDIPSRIANPDVAEACKSSCREMLLSNRRTTSLGQRLQEHWLEAPGGIGTLAQSAESLGMSPRTLHRRLCDEGHRYRDLVEAFRKDYAVKLLADGQMDVKSVAYRLGYADCSSFRRSFRSWTGQAIGQWQHGAGQDGLRPRLPS